MTQKDKSTLFKNVIDYNVYTTRASEIDLNINNEIYKS